MKTKIELEQSLKDVTLTINGYFDKLTDAMCNGNDYKEREYQRQISLLENRKEILEWVLN